MSERIYSCLIVDDEEEARDILGFLLQEHDDVEIIGKAGSVEEAEPLVSNRHPDIVFLDVKMPGEDGFSLVSIIKEVSPGTRIVFVTAYEEFAIDAIKEAVFDYLLKPIDNDELEMTLQRIRNDILKSAEEMEAPVGRSETGRLKFNTRQGYMLLEPMEIIYMQADGNYTHIHLVDGEEEVISTTLGNLETLLDDSVFFRIGRDIIINIRYLSKVNRVQRTCTLKLNEDRLVLPCSKSRLKLLEEKV